MSTHDHDNGSQWMTDSRTRAWRFVLAQSKDGRGSDLDLLSDEIGDCRRCWSDIATYLSALVYEGVAEAHNWDEDAATAEVLDRAASAMGSRSN